MDAHRNIIKDNARTTLKIITACYNCKYFSILYQILEKHPDFPSFLSFQYILQIMGKESYAIHVCYKELISMPVPFIAHIETNINLLIVITKVTDEFICLINERQQEEMIARKDFENMWDGNILLIDNLPGKFDPTFKVVFNAFIEKARYTFLFSCLILLLIYLLILKTAENPLFSLYSLGILGGLGVSILLFIEQIDKYNIYIKKMCSTTNKSKVDCSSILDFKDAFFIGLISWSDIGFVYFSFLLITILILPFSLSQSLINILSLLSIGYVCFSLFYQKFIAQKWCTLCLSVQAVFVYLFILGAFTLKSISFSSLLYINSIINILLIFLATTSIYMVIKPIVVKQRECISLKNKFNELLYDENIMQYLFQQEYHCNDIERVNRISIGNSNAETCLALIFSPICVSCIKELQILIPILQKKHNTKLDLIFLLDRRKYPESVVIADHLLSEYKINPEQFVTILQKYVDNYPVSKNRIMQSTSCPQEKLKNKSIIKEQEEWCINHKFYSTPILLVNGYKFPHYYNMTDIDYLYN